MTPGGLSLSRTFNISVRPSVSRACRVSSGRRRGSLDQADPLISTTTCPTCAPRVISQSQPRASTPPRTCDPRFALISQPITRDYLALLTRIQRPHLRAAQGSMAGCEPSHGRAAAPQGEVRHGLHRGTRPERRKHAEGSRAVRDSTRGVLGRRRDVRAHAPDALPDHHQPELHRQPRSRRDPLREHDGPPDRGARLGRVPLGREAGRPSEPAANQNNETNCLPIPSGESHKLTDVSSARSTGLGV